MSKAPAMTDAQALTHSAAIFIESLGKASLRRLGSEIAETLALKAVAEFDWPEGMAENIRQSVATRIIERSAGL